MEKMQRRDFLLAAGALTAAGSTVLLGCQADSNSQAQKAPAGFTGKKIRWNMVTTWQAGFPVMGEGVDLFAQWIEEMSQGELSIKVYGAGELVPAMESFEAVSGGAAQMGHGAAYYWAGKVPAAQFFTCVPFGMNAQQMSAWIHHGGALPLWENLYADFNLVPMPMGNTGVQMGGWFNRKINSLSDLKGLKMRIPGLGGQVLSRAGGTAILSPGGEIYTNLERGVIDATEWIGPYHDYLMGFHKIAKYYYYPGWHEPGSVLELIINKRSWENLPGHLQAIVRGAAARVDQWMLSRFEAENRVYLAKIKEEKGVQILPFSPEILLELKRHTEEVLEDLAAKNPAAKTVYESFSKFRNEMTDWSRLSEQAYHSLPA